ncbi:MAG: chemotaxis protein CheA [Pseudomonadota bacterium]|nr:chemotaxis protein CheA [Pseudomonadota bacterium]
MEHDELGEILQEFFTEADESLDELEQDLIKLETISESGDFDADLVDRIFRVLHTLKGGAGFLSLDKMSKLAHAGENLLDEVRGENVDVTKDVMDALLTTNDMLKDMLDMSKDGEDSNTFEIDEMVQELETLTNGGGAPAPKKTEPAVEEAPVEEPEEQEIEVETSVEDADVTVDSDLLAEVMADERLAGTDDTEEEEFTPEEEEASDDVAVDADLLAEVMADERLADKEEAPEESVKVEEKPKKKTAKKPAKADVKEENASEADMEKALQEEPVDDDEADVKIDLDLLAEVLADKRLAGDKDTGDEPTDPSASGVDLQLLAEVMADERLGDVIKHQVKKAEAKKPDNRAGERRVGRGDRRKTDRRGGKASAADVMIRVETGRLDAIMNDVGELVLARNSLVRSLERPHIAEKLEEEEYLGIMAQTEQLTRGIRSLQSAVLGTRMQPIKKVFDKIPRQVRELKSKLNKDVDLLIEGEDTEVDKTLVDELADPMIHLIRNSLDHGLETPEERTAMGKAPSGTLSVRAFYEGNNVVIQIQDDGKGIDPVVIRKKAIEKELHDAETIEAMSDQDAINLIFAPGFSTAEQVSDVSGRGVGMDVVNSKIQSVKGSISLTSEFGVGTCVTIYLPLTLAIVQTLVVRAKEEGFAVPIGDIAEVIKFNKGDVHQVNKRDVIELRGEVLPLFYLEALTHGISMPGRQKLDLDDAYVDDPDMSPLRKRLRQRSQKTTPFILVVREGGNALGLVVDGLLGQEEAVVKPISKVFGHHEAISGATITGEGYVHMILDVPYLMKQL